MEGSFDLATGPPCRSKSFQVSSEIGRGVYNTPKPKEIKMSDTHVRIELEKKHGVVYNTEELQQNYIVHSFLAPFILCTRKSDGVRGTLQFTHDPRFYFDFKPE